MKRIFVALMLAGLALTSCRRAENDAAPRQRFVVQGVLRGINFAEKSVSVEHEDIPGYMPSMTMPFAVKMMAEVEPLRAGDAIEFTMIVTDSDSWIEGVKKIDVREIRLPTRAVTAANPQPGAARLKEGDALPEFQLVDSAGRAITRETFAGRPLLLTFIFTRCPIPTFCPLITDRFREIQQSLSGATAPAADAQLLSISFDSEFDTPEVLARYAARHAADSGRWHFATGTPEETKRLTDAFSLTVQPEGGTISHGLATALVGADGTIRRIWRGNGWRPAEVIDALLELTAAR